MGRAIRATARRTPDGPDTLPKSKGKPAPLPTRDELIAKLLYLLQSPITRLVRTLAAVPRDFVVVLSQVAKQNTES